MATAGNVLACKRYTTNGTSLSGGTGYYPANTLTVLQSTDEDGHVSYTFTDRLGRTVLVRQLEGSTQHDTYYVYDSRDNLCFVLQPEYQTVHDLEKYAFQYKYDGYGRCTEKTIPGAGTTRYDYDAADRVIFSQDGNQNAQNRWTYYEYDNLNRLTEQGECNGKDKNTKTVWMKNYYDNYDFRSQAGFNNSNFPADNTGYGKGYLTGSEITVLGTSTRLYTAYYYDVKGQVTKTVQSNLLNGYEVTTTSYTFTGQPQTVPHTHSASGKSSVTEVYTYTYDYEDRLTQVQHKLGSAQVTLAAYTYDNLGRMQTRKLHGSTTNQLTYSYNVRDWLTGITGTKFNQNLYYNTGSGTACYNGNISSMIWKAGNETTQRGYKFAYDGLNRLTSATYGEGTGISSNANRFTEKVTSYDKNGNIKGLQRYGQTSASAYGLIDNLTYTLDGNRPTRVDDAVSASAYNNGFEFKDGTKTANEYAYDANGNLIKDSNRNISTIEYNCLNLPNKVTFTDGSTIEYVYATDGTKLRTVHTIGGTTTTTDYCGNVIYENGVRKYLLTDEGYVTLAENKYHYYLKDHQGNNRVVVDQNGTVKETNHYYPFGGLFASSSSIQSYKYNGKEYDDTKGVNWYDYGARMYDPALGRFTTQDRFAEKYPAMSLYQYGANNPICNIDVNGDSLFVSNPALVDAIQNGFEKGNDIQMKWNNGILDPNSIKEQAINSNDFFLKDLYEIASSDKIVEMSLSDVNIYKIDGKIMSEPFMPVIDDNSKDLDPIYQELIRIGGGTVGKGIRGNTGQTLVPKKGLASGKQSLNDNIQIIINGKSLINHQTVGIAHEFGHVLLYLNNKPFSHTQPGVDDFVYGRATMMSKRLGYDY